MKNFRQIIKTLTYLIGLGLYYTPSQYSSLIEIEHFLYLLGIAYLSKDHLPDFNNIENRLFKKTSKDENSNGNDGNSAK